VCVLSTRSCGGRLDDLQHENAEEVFAREAGAKLAGVRVRGARGSVYLLCWYKRTNADAEGGSDEEPQAPDATRPTGAQFACFTGTTVQLLTARCLLSWYKSTNTDS